jgi:hypothetical protein
MKQGDSDLSEENLLLSYRRPGEDWCAFICEDSEPFVLLAESFSTPVAIRVAAENPTNLKGLILCAGFATSPVSGLPRMLGWLLAVSSGADAITGCCDESTADRNGCSRRSSAPGARCRSVGKCECSCRPAASHIEVQCLCGTNQDRNSGPLSAGGPRPPGAIALS